MILNEFSAKKLGEVAAFARVGIETLVKGRNALSPILAVGDTITLFEEHEKSLQGLAEGYGVTEVFATKTSTTSDKLRQMRDMYVGEEWDNPTELLEWFGFFEGAAIVHWGLVLGVGEGKDDQILKDLASSAIHIHEGLLAEARANLQKTGSGKAVL